MDVTVIGCGVIGLSTGIRLLEQGFGVKIVARDLPPNTTSNWAAAIWYPYKAFPEDKVLGWGTAAFQAFERLMAEPGTGVGLTTLLEPFDRPVADPWWKEAVTEFRRATAEELPEGYTDGYVVTVPVIDTRIYMDYLLNRFQELGGTVVQREVAHLEEVAEPNGIVVNCAGLGSRELVGDEEVYPIRGQVVRVKAPAVGRAFVDEFGQHKLTYVIPRTNDVILGGTADEHSWDLQPDDQTAEKILHHTKIVEPALEGAEILQHGVGLRPGRPQVRLEAETLTNGCLVVHNYGHGGAGFTLSWGCADEVMALVQQCAR